MALSLYDPFSAVVVPLADGMTRQRLLRRGVQQREAVVGGVGVNYYRRYLWGKPVRHWRTMPRNMPILLVHGIGDSALTWALIMRRLAREHDVYAVDLLGHGSSALPGGRSYATIEEYREMLEGFIREVIRRPALIVGNSLGGMLAVRVANSSPELVRGIAMLNPGGAPLLGRESYDRFFAKISDNSLVTAYRVSGEMIGVVPRPMLILGLRSIQRLFQRPAILDAYAMADERIFLSIDELHRLRVPAALIWGTRDRFLPEGSLEFWLTALPHAPKLLLRYCGHLPQRERPAAVGNWLRRFANGLA